VTAMSLYMPIPGEGCGMAGDIYCAATEE
jgi:hypothetical protein